MCVCERERGWWHPNHSCRPLLNYLPVICILSRQVLDQDNYSPIPVSTEQEFKHYTSQFPLQDPELEKVRSDRRNVSIRLLQLKSHLNPRFSAPFPPASLPKEASLLRVCAKSLLPAQRVHLCVSEILRRPAPQVHSHKKLKPFIYLPTLMIINQSVFVQFGNHFGQHLLLCGSKKGEGNVVPSSAHLESKAHICCCGHVTSRHVCFGRQPYSYLLLAGSTCQLNSIKSHFSASMPAIAVFALREFV